MKRDTCGICIGVVLALAIVVCIGVVIDLVMACFVGAARRTVKFEDYDAFDERFHAIQVTGIHVQVVLRFSLHAE